MSSGSDGEIFAAIADERVTLAGTLQALSDEQWQTQSLCAAWSVRDVAAHLVSPLVVPIWRFGLTMVRTLGDFDKANRIVTRRVVDRYGDRLPELLADRASHRFTPPGYGPLAPLTDVIVHGFDIRRPLGIDHQIPAERLKTVLDFLTESDAHGFVVHPVNDFHWVATDIDWEYGSGPTVRGSAQSLILVLTGRDGELSGVDGPGAERLAGSG